MNKFAEWFNGVFGDGTFAKITGFALTVIVGIIIIKIIMAVIQNALSRSKLEKAAHSLIKSVVKTVLYALLALIAASSLGIDVTGIVALASVASLALSLALQNILTNIIGGFTLIYTKPFHSGDWVEIAGQSGTVKEIGMAYTKLTTADNKLVQIPNSAVVASEIINYTVTGTRRVDIAVSASYDVDKVLGALKKAADIDLILNDPALFAAVSGYGDHAISYVVRVWTKTENYWDVYNTVTYNIKKEFDENGIEMTYPHLNVHLDK